MIGIQCTVSARTGNILDKNSKLHSGDSEEDNVDAPHESPRKSTIARPILKADAPMSLHILTRKHIAPLVKESILSIFPPNAVKRAEGGKYRKRRYA